MKSVGLSSETSSVGWDTAYRPTEKLGKEASTSIATAQFRYINTQAVEFLAANEPVISVDTKKWRPGMAKER
jgi:hypothetical protein